MTFRFWLLLCVTLISIPALTDWLVDRQSRSEPVGYTRQDRDAMSRLVERSIAAPATHDCGEDYLCLIAWAEEQNPTKHKKGRHS